MFSLPFYKVLINICFNSLMAVQPEGASQHNDKRSLNLAG